MDILLSNAYIPVKGGLRKGYVYVSEGTVAEVGEGEPPEDLTTAQLIYPISGGLVLRGLASPIVSVASYWARGLLGTHLTWREAFARFAKLEPKEAVGITLLALKQLALRGYALYGILAERPRFHHELVEEFDGHVVWLRLEGVEHTGPAQRVLHIDSMRKPFAKLGSLGVEEVVWENGSRSVCGLVDEPDPSDSLCLVPDHVWGIPSLYAHLAMLPLETLYALTSGNAFKQLLGGGYGLSIERGEAADLVVLDLGEPPLCGLSPEEAAKMFYAGLLSTPAVEVVISKGEVLVDNGQPIAFNDQLIRRGIEAMRRLRESAGGGTA